MFQSLKHNFKELILILWIMISEHASKYGNIMLINVMKFDRLILKKVRTNLQKFFFSAYFRPPPKLEILHPSLDGREEILWCCSKCFGVFALVTFVLVL